MTQPFPEQIQNLIDAMNHFGLTSDEFDTEFRRLMGAGYSEEEVERGLRDRPDYLARIGRGITKRKTQ